MDLRVIWTMLKKSSTWETFIFDSITMYKVTDHVTNKQANKVSLFLYIIKIPQFETYLINTNNNTLHKIGIVNILVRKTSSMTSTIHYP